MISGRDLEHALETVQSIPRTDVYSMLAGTAAFGSTLALSTMTQQMFHISTASRPPLPTLLGLASVCVASLASHHATIATNQYLQWGYLPSWKIWEYSQNAIFSFREDYLDLNLVQIPLHTVRICCLGLLTFKLLGGRYWAIAPSSYTHLGSFARPRFSLVATHKYASEVQRASIERMGRLIGCHTCGSRMFFQRGAFKFVGDHMPPKSVAERLNRIWYRRLLGIRAGFRFFPQCRDCSSLQGSILSKAINDFKLRSPGIFPRGRLRLPNGKAYYHGLSPRIHHLTGGVLGAVAVVGANQADIVDGNRWRYTKIHRQIGQWILDTGNDALDLLSSLQPR